MIGNVEGGEQHTKKAHQVDILAAETQLLNRSLVQSIRD